MKKTSKSIPNFILCDKHIPFSFMEMCQKFQAQQKVSNLTSSDWLIIDNDTGRIITPDTTDSFPKNT